MLPPLDTKRLKSSVEEFALLHESHTILFGKGLYPLITSAARRWAHKEAIEILKHGGRIMYELDQSIVLSQLRFTVLKHIKVTETVRKEIVSQQVKVSTNELRVLQSPA